MPIYYHQRIRQKGFGTVMMMATAGKNLIEVAVPAESGGRPS